MLHLANGDSTAGALRTAGLSGEVIVWADVLHDGPVLTGVSRAEYLAARAAFLASTGAGDQDEIAGQLARRDAALDTIAQHDELVMWFEHDLYDQLILAHHLDWLARHDVADTRLSLVCIDRHPRVERFCGLGQLSPDDMPALFDARQPITQAQVALGVAAWRAVGGEDPTVVERLCAGDTDALPFLAPALRRWLEEYPSVADGLSRTQRQILRALADGPATGMALFRGVDAAEPAPFMGDTMLFHEVRRLAWGTEALVECEDGVAKDPARGVVRLTGAGRAVLNGQADAVAVNGIDRWLGGVHLTGHDPMWRWDDGCGRLVRRA